MDFDELKKKVAVTAGNVADKSVEVAKVVAEKTKILAIKAKLTAEIVAEKDTLRKAYRDLGKLYFDKFGADPADDLVQAVEAIKLSLEKISAKNAEIETLNAPAADDECECCEDDDCCCECEEESEE